MFEVIGILVAGFIVLTPGTGIVRGVANNAKMKAADFACEQGVPHEFALKAVNARN
ncbi:MAG: hypothetical protein KUG79_06795 [Pseudomonadales bacterium]|nr:hypothetical protein [Pseudomonadales bacterium]